MRKEKADQGCEGVREGVELWAELHLLIVIMFIAGTE